MKTTPKEERMHVIDILDYQTRVAETLSEIEGEFNYVRMFSLVPLIKEKNIFS